jgi:NAD(P)-dependent dehydrogenase (short-subunit alcohol dehydrogenase family)
MRGARVRYVITGAGSGIGRAVAELAAREAGSTGLALVDRDPASLDAVVESVRGLGAHAVPIVADLADPEAPGRAIETAVGELGGLEALVSNAGMTSVDNLEDLSLGTYERTFALNTRATWLLAKAAFPALRDGGGAVVATASISARNATPPLGMYSPSKAALLMIVQQMALEWGRHGIRANCVSPGPTDTGLTRASFGPEADATARANREHRLATTPLRRIAEARDIAEAIVYLAGPRAAHVTGVDLPVDGGISVAVMPLAGGLPGYHPGVPAPAVVEEVAG